MQIEPVVSSLTQLKIRDLPSQVAEELSKIAHAFVVRMREGETHPALFLTEAENPTGVRHPAPEVGAF